MSHHFIVLEAKYGRRCIYISWNSLQANMLAGANTLFWFTSAIDVVLSHLSLGSNSGTC